MPGPLPPGVRLVPGAAPGIALDLLPEALQDLARAARFEVYEAGGAQVHWRVWGDRGPVIVLLHGGFGSWLHWAANIRALATRHRVVVCDIPGYGGTAPPAQVTRLADLARPIAATLPVLIGAAPHLLCGFSFGAMLAGFVAPLSGASGLALLGSPGCGPIRESLPGMRSWRGLPAAERPAAHAQNLRSLMLHMEESLDETAIRIQSLNAEAAIADYRAAIDRDAADDALRACTCPVQAVWGAEDPLVRGYLDERRAVIRSLGPQAAIEIWPDLGHWLAWEAPGRVNALLATLAARAEATAHPHKIVASAAGMITAQR